ncbi:MAG: metal-dependent hydrolase, partial [Pseudomonadota bacterium]
ALADGLPDREPVDRIAWFSHGFHALAREGDDILLRDLRLGVEPNYVLTFKIAEFNSASTAMVRPARISNSPDWSQIGWLWWRIFDPAAVRDE